MREDFASGQADFHVSVRSAAGDFAGVRTDFRVDRWDEEQVQWAYRKAAQDFTLLSPDHLTPAIFGYYGVQPYSTTIEENCNLIVVAGWGALLGGVAGTTITNKFSATNGRIGVGTSNTAASSSQTALQGDTGGSSTTSYYKLVSGAPTLSTAATPCTMVFTSVFGTSVANFAWAEFGTDNYTTDGVTTTGLGANFIFFNRGVSNQGTKASGQIWTATETLSFGYPTGSGTVG